MSAKVKSKDGVLFFRGFRSNIPQELDGGRLKFSPPRAPKGVEITAEMMDEALEKVQKAPNIQRTHRNQSGEIIVTPKGSHSASRAVRLREHLEKDVFRLIVNAIIAVNREVRRKLKQVTAAQKNTLKKENASGFLNDKTRTIPVPSPANS